MSSGYSAPQELPPNETFPHTNGLDSFAAGNDHVFGPEASAYQESALSDGVTTQATRCEVGGHQYYFEVSTAAKESGSTHPTSDNEEERENEDAHFLDEENLAMGVFDGLGAHKGSAEAANDAAQYCEADLLLMVPGALEPDRAEAFLAQSLLGAHRRIAAMGKNIGTTGALFKVSTDGEGRRFGAFAQAGDSRIYRLRGGELTMLTCDHNLVRQLTGSREQAMEWQLLLANATCEEDLVGKDENETRALRILFKHRSGISSSLGIGDPEIETSTTDVQTGDVFVLVTDGLCDNLTTSNSADLSIPSMQNILAHGGSAQDLVVAARKVSRLGLFRSKPDDMKVVMMTAA